MRCWRCAKENQDGLIKCVVCSSELTKQIEPWFCRTCFRRCLQETCSLCGSGRAAGVAAASKAASSVISREVTSKLRSRRYSKWITNAKQSHSNNKQVFDLGNYDEVYSNSNSKNNKIESTIDKETTFEKLKNEILARNRPKPLINNKILEVEDEDDNDDKEGGDGYLINEKGKGSKGGVSLLGTTKRTSKLSNEEIVALLWEALSVVSIQKFLLDNTTRISLRLTASIANLLPQPSVIHNNSLFNINFRKSSHSGHIDFKGISSDGNHNVSLQNTKYEEEDKVESEDKSAYLASRARRRRAAKDLEHAKREELTSARQRKAAATAANLAAIALEHSRLPTPPAARHWFILMKRSHLQKYSNNRFLFKYKPLTPSQLLAREAQNQVEANSKKNSGGSSSTMVKGNKSRPQSASKSRSQSASMKKLKGKSNNNNGKGDGGGGGGGDGGDIQYDVKVTNNMNMSNLNKQSNRLQSSKSTTIEKTSSLCKDPVIRPKTPLYGGRMLGEAAARQKEKENFISLAQKEQATLSNNRGKNRKLVIDVRGGGNAVNVVCCCANDLGWRVIKNKNHRNNTLNNTLISDSTIVDDDGVVTIDDSDSSNDDDDEEDDDDDEEEEDSSSDEDSDDSDGGGSLTASVRTIDKKRRHVSNAVSSPSPSNHLKSKIIHNSSSATAMPPPTRGIPSISTSTTGVSSSSAMVTQSAFKTIGYADIVWLADYHVNNNLAINLTRHGPRRRLRNDLNSVNMNEMGAPSRADPSTPIMMTSSGIPSSSSSQPSSHSSNINQQDMRSKEEEMLNNENKQGMTINNDKIKQKQQQHDDIINSNNEHYKDRIIMNEFENMMLKYEKTLINNLNNNNGVLLNDSIRSNININIHEEIEDNTSQILNNTTSTPSTPSHMMNNSNSSSSSPLFKWRRRWVNHFPGMNRLVSKANLGKELNRYLNLLSFQGKKAFQFFPKTFLLPEQENEAIAFLEYNKNGQDDYHHNLYKFKNKRPSTVGPSPSSNNNNSSSVNKYRRGDKKKMKNYKKSKFRKKNNLSSSGGGLNKIITNVIKEDVNVEIKKQKSFKRDRSAGMMKKDTRVSSTSKNASSLNQRTLIIKPSNGSQGKGIVLVQSAQAVKDISFSAAATRYTKGGDEYVCQEYMSKPILLSNLKFDLRIYVLVMASEDMDHVDAWLCEEGLARFATCPYQAPDASNLDSQFMHLTNYSLNKDSKDFIADGGDNDHKRPLTAVFNELKQVYSNLKLSTIWRELGRVAAHTVSVISPQLLSSRRAFSVERERIRRQAKALKIFKSQKGGNGDSATSGGVSSSSAPSSQSNTGSFPNLNGSMNNSEPNSPPLAGVGSVGINGRGVSNGVHSSKVRLNGSLSGVEELLNKPTQPPMLLPCCFQIIGIDVMLVHDDDDEDDDNDEEEEVFENKNNVNNEKNETDDKDDVDDDVSECSTLNDHGEEDDEENEMKIKAILIEINSNPALSIGHKGSRSVVDEKVKRIAVNGALYAVENWDSRLKQRKDKHEKTTTEERQSTEEHNDDEDDDDEEEEEFDIEGYFQVAEAGKWLGTSAIPTSCLEEDDNDEYEDIDDETEENSSLCSNRSKIKQNIITSNASVASNTVGRGGNSIIHMERGGSANEIPVNDREFHRILDLILDIRHCFEACAGTPNVYSTSYKHTSHSNLTNHSNSINGNSNSTQELANMLILNGCHDIASEVQSESWVFGSYSLALSHLLAPGPEAGEEPRWQLSRNQFVQFGRRCLDPNSNCLATASLDALFAAVTKKGYLTARRMGAIEDNNGGGGGVDRSGRQQMNFSLFLDALINLSKLIYLKSPSSIGNNGGGGSGMHQTSFNMRRRPNTGVTNQTNPLSSSSSFPSSSPSLYINSSYLSSPSSLSSSSTTYNGGFGFAPNSSILNPSSTSNTSKLLSPSSSSTRPSPSSTTPKREINISSEVKSSDIGDNKIKNKKVKKKTNSINLDKNETPTSDIQIEKNQKGVTNENADESEVKVTKSDSVSADNEEEMTSSIQKEKFNPNTENSISQSLNKAIHVKTAAVVVKEEEEDNTKNKDIVLNKEVNNTALPSSTTIDSSSPSAAAAAIEILVPQVLTSSSPCLFRSGGIEAPLANMVKMLHQRLFTAAKLILSQDQISAASMLNASNITSSSSTHQSSSQPSQNRTTSTLRAVEAVIQQKLKVGNNTMIDNQSFVGDDVRDEFNWTSPIIPSNQNKSSIHTNSTSSSNTNNNNERVTYSRKSSSRHQRSREGTRTSNSGGRTSSDSRESLPLIPPNRIPSQSK